MRLFSVHTVEQRHRRITVAAKDAFSAERAVRARLSRGARIVERPVPLEEIDTLASGRGALALLLATAYLPRDAAPMTVGDWVRLAGSAGTADEAEALNVRLAPLGLRVLDDTLWIGTASRIPSLALIYDGTEWSGRGLADALRQLPGARPALKTFAGMRSRCLGIALSVVFEQTPPHEAAA